MSELKRIQIGESVKGWPSSTWNCVLDAVDDFRSRGGPNEGRLIQPDVKDWIVNKASDIDDPFGILEFDSPLNDLTANANESYKPLKAVNGVAPTSSNGVFCVLQRSCSQDKAVPAVWSGMTWCKVDVKAEGDSTCGTLTGDTGKLESGRSGASILWKEKASEAVPANRLGEQWAIIDLRPSGTGDSVFPVMVVGTVPGASYTLDSTEKRLANAGAGDVTAYRFGSPESSPPTGWIGNFTDPNPITIKNVMPDTIVIPSGSGRVGLATSMYLLQLSCQDVTFTAPT